MSFVKRLSFSGSWAFPGRSTIEQRRRPGSGPCSSHECSSLGQLVSNAIAYTAVLTRPLNRDFLEGLLVDVVGSMAASDRPLEVAVRVGAAQLLLSVLRTSWDSLHKPIARQKDVLLDVLLQQANKDLSTLF